MEDLKEMFAQMMKFQMESQQENEEKLLQLQKENEERIFQLLQRNKEKEQIKWGKTTTVLPWIAKTTRSTF